IDLAVERYPNGLILVRQRLTTAGRVDNPEPPRRQGCVLRAVESFLIRAAVGERPRHRGERGRRYRLIPAEVHNAADAAHSPTPRPQPLPVAGSADRCLRGE